MTSEVSTHLHQNQMFYCWSKFGRIYIQKYFIFLERCSTYTRKYETIKIEPRHNVLGGIMTTQIEIIRDGKKYNFSPFFSKFVSNEFIFHFEIIIKAIIMVSSTYHRPFLLEVPHVINWAISHTSNNGNNYAKYSHTNKPNKKFIKACLRIMWCCVVSSWVCISVPWHQYLLI